MTVVGPPPLSRRRSVSPLFRGTVTAGEHGLPEACAGDAQGADSGRSARYFLVLDEPFVNNPADRARDRGGARRHQAAARCEASVSQETDDPAQPDNIRRELRDGGRCQA